MNQEGLDFYDRLVDKLLEYNIKPCATLYHWELPSALADKGGWRNRDIAHWFADFTEIIMKKIGDRVFSVAPINEPWCVSWLSHFLGAHAPGLRDIRATARAMHHVLLAHGQAIETMRGLGMKNLGCVFNHEWVKPVDDSVEAAESAALYDAYYNRFFIGGVFHKSYPEILLPALEPHLPKNWQDDFAVIGKPIDWCGLNYYTRKIIAPNIEANNMAWPAHHEVAGDLPKTQMGWEIYPDGLYQFIMRAQNEYAKGLPIYITENGMANPDVLNSQGGVDDAMRIDYLNQHFAAMKRAIADGANVNGYFIWSFLDNYEWALGYEKRFGLVHVDFETLERTPKASYLAMQHMFAEVTVLNKAYLANMCG